MANVVSSFSSAADFESAYLDVNSSLSLASAVSLGLGAYNNAFFGTAASVSSASYSYVSGTLDNGDRFSEWGSNLTSRPNVVTHLDYTFVSTGISVSLFGNVSINPAGFASGYIDKVIVSSTSYGTVTITGYDDVSSTAASTISSVTWNHNGAEASASGSVAADVSVVDGHYQPTITGAYTAMSMVFAGQSMQLSNANVAASSIFSSANAFLAYALESSDAIAGSGGNTYLSGFAGNDSIDGGSGIDTAGFNGNRANYTLSTSASNYVVTDNTGTDGTDTLTSIERLQFADKKIALDLTPDGHTGQAMGFIGAVAPDLLNNTAIRGLIISLFDQGQTMESLSQLALDQNLISTPSNAALANAVYRNVLNGPASTDMTNALVDYIEDHGQANFLATVAGLHINVDLVGLQQTGVEYLI